jgi:hypothetical protein
MGATVNLEVEAALRTLEKVAQGFPPASAEAHAIELAAHALGFVFITNQVDAFSEHVRTAHIPADQCIFISHEFKDMTEAQAWLHGQPAPAVGTLVKLSGRTHTVFRAGDGTLLMGPSLTPQELEKLGEPED